MDTPPWLHHPLVLIAAGAIGGAVVYHFFFRRQRIRSPELVERLPYRPFPQPLLQQPVSEEKGPVYPTWDEAMAAVAQSKKKKKNKKKRKRAKTEITGITLRRGRLRIEDWSAWMEYAPRMMDIAVAAGAKTSGEVLKVVLDGSLPQYPWPPAEGSKLREQWNRLSRVVAASIGLPDLPPDDGQKEDSSFIQDEDVPYLRLVT